MQTPMIDEGNNRFSVTITIPTGLNIRQVFFVLYFPRSHQWDNNLQQDYAIPLPSDPDILSLLVRQKENTPVRSLAGLILGRENRKSWEMGMRLEFIGQLLDEFEPAESMLSLLEIYLQYAAQGHLPWRRHYDRQTYILAPKILGLAIKISGMVSSYPRFLHFFRRMLGNLPSSGRNLQDIGLAIRLKILECKDHQNRLIYDRFVSEFHQKLHNASGPEDVAVCRAYLAFLDSHGDIDRFGESLWQAGLAKKENRDGQEVIIPLLDIYGDYRSIQHLPTYEPGKAQPTRKVFQELLTLLENFFGGMEVEEAIALVQLRADSALRQGLLDFLAHKEKPKEQGTGPDIIRHLSHLRHQLHAKVLCTSTAEEIRDLLHLDLVLDNYARALAGSLLNDLVFRSNDQPAESLSVCLELFPAILLHLFPGGLLDPEILLIQQQVHQWGKRGDCRGNECDHEYDEDWCLQGKAIFDRLSRVVQAQVSRQVALYQPKAELLGRLLEIRPQVWQTFSEENLRNDWLFYLSRLVTLIRQVLRRIAGWSPTEVLVPGRVRGIVTRLPDLSSIPSSSSFPLILLVNHLRGDEDIPGSVAALISRVPRDRMSHFGIRAREQGVVWIYCEEESGYRQLEAYEGRWIELAADEDHFHTAPIEPSSAMHQPATRAARPGFSVPPVRLAESFTLLTPDRYELSTVGPKACQLRLLTERLSGQVQVPDSLAVPFGVFDLVLRSNPKGCSQYRHITAALAAESGGGVSGLLETVRGLIESLDIDEAYSAELKRTVRERFGREVPLIVRSSSNAEDLEGYSGAGLYESYPGVGCEELPRYLKKVWASQWTQRAVSNRARSGVLPEDVHLAVLIQELIPADYAFVTHTRYPLTGRQQGQVYIEVVQGLGESLVGGSEGQGYRFLYDRTSQEVKRAGFANKGHRWVIGQDGLPARILADYSNDFLSLEKKNWETLIGHIGRISVMIEAAWGNQPQDIEGVIRGREVFIVQTRPQV